jgi:probable HAF family extracellular repeat protein
MMRKERVLFKAATCFGSLRGMPCKRWTPRAANGSRLAVVLSAVLFAVLATGAQASLEMIDLGTLGGNVSEAFSVSPDGKVTGLSFNADDEEHAFLWTEAGGTVQIGPPGIPCYAISVNDSGQVAGTTMGKSGLYHAFLWTEAGGMVYLGILGTNWSVARAANVLGQVVGESSSSGGSLWYAWSWTRSGGMINLGFGTAHAVNDNGQVVGQDGVKHAFSWTEAGGMVNLGEGFAQAVNNNGQVVGLTTASLGEYQAFSWTQSEGRILLGTLGGRYAWANAVNDSGQVVGTSETADGSTHAFSWTKDGGMIDLGTLGGKNSNVGWWDISFAARAVNAGGQVVGWSETVDGETHAFSWTKEGGMVDLGTLGGTESGAYAVNDRGDIVGYGSTIDGFHHAVLWKVRPLVIYPSSLNCGKVVKGASSDKTINLRNVGTVPLMLADIALPASPFKIAGGTCSVPQTLATGESCTVVIRFSPTELGLATTAVKVTSTDPGEPSVKVRLSGQGVLLLVTPDEGTLGDEITITGSGFGVSKGKLVIGGVGPKITKWSENEIRGTLNKVPLPDMASDVIVQPKTKGSPPILEPAAFTARGPRITGVDQVIAVPGNTMIIFGNLFLESKGKVTLERDGEEKSCKVVTWTTDQIRWRVPKMEPGEATLRVSNKAGSSTWILQVGQ